MQKAPGVIDGETMRLAALETLVLPCEDLHQVFDRFVHLAAEVFQVPMTTVAFMGHDHQLHVAQKGLEQTRVPRADTICTFTVAENRTVLIPDAGADLRWRTNPSVAGHPHLRFYAGTPVHVRGQPVGTFCLLDQRPHHTFDEADRDLLESFAFIVTDLLELHQLRGSGADAATSRLSRSIFQPAA